MTFRLKRRKYRVAWTLTRTLMGAKLKLSMLTEEKTILARNQSPSMTKTFHRRHHQTRSTTRPKTLKLTTVEIRTEKAMEKKISTAKMMATLKKKLVNKRHLKPRTTRILMEMDKSKTKMLQATMQKAKEETESDKDTSEALETMAPTAKQQVTESPSPAPTAMVTEAKVVVTSSPTKAPVDDDLSPSPSRTPPDINNNDHDDASEAKSREKQPHTATPSGPDGGPTFGALCRHPNGLVQGANCKVILGFQSHPLAFSGAFLLLFIWGCCLCKRVCKGRSRREADHGEYRAVAAQYDDVLFSDTFDDNYSASFADDRSADGSIESDEEDDWTKGPNIEMGAISHKEDDLTLEEMNG